MTILPAPLWGKVYGYFIEETESEMEVVEYRGGWGRIEPDRGFGVVYTPEPGKRVGSGDTVKIELDYAARYVERYGLSEDKCGFDMGAQ